MKDIIVLTNILLGTFSFCSVLNLGAAISDSAIRVSRRKCIEYQQLCPPKAIKFNNSIEDAAPEEFPFVGRVQYSIDECRNIAILISENFVLTFLGYKSLLPQHIIFTGRRIKVVQQFLHPQLKRNFDYLALVKLSESITFNDDIRPACLSEPNSVIPEHLIKINRNYNRSVRYLRKVKVKFNTSTETIVNVSRRKMRRYDCLAYDGSVLSNAYNEFSCLNEIYGIDARGGDCGFDDEKFDFIRVSSLIDWIERIVWPIEYDATTNMATSESTTSASEE